MPHTVRIGEALTPTTFKSRLDRLLFLLLLLLLLLSLFARLKPRLESY